MVYRTLLAHLDREDTADAVMDVAVRIAESHGAHLTGLHLVPPVNIHMYYQVGLMAATYSEAWVKTQNEIGERLAERFAKATDRANLVAEWRLIDVAGDPIHRHVIEIGNTADLLLVGLMLDAEHSPSRDTIVAKILAGSGRPVMVVPSERSQSTVGRRVLVAWDGQGASTRALFSALPLLARADAVRLQRINPPQQAHRHRAFGTTDDIAATLARHDVKVEVFTSIAREAAIAEELLAFAHEWNADTLVAGCYEHGATRELLLGSTTRHLLTHARMPLLMSN